MRLGFYDSGLGGLSVLKEFVGKFGSKYSYSYFGDSARAPYGDKSPEQLKSYVFEIAEYMQADDVDILISACNTSSMYLDEIDLSDFSFQMISLKNVMDKYFADNAAKYQAKRIALMATNATIDSGRYKNWPVDIYPVKCPTIVPLLEAAQLDAAKLEWQRYLNELPKDIKDVIIGCTHYSLLNVQASDYNFIDPAKLVLEQFSSSIFNDGMINYSKKNANTELDIKINFTKGSDEYLKLATELLDLH